MIFDARKMLMVVSFFRLVGAAAAFAALLYGTYLAVQGSLATGGAWVIGSIFFGFAANMVLGLVALLVSGMAAPSVRR